MQPLTVAQFRALFPAFADSTIYPDAMIQAWLDLAPVDPCIWGPLYQFGQALWAAHELAKLASSTAANPSGAGGPIQSKSVGPVSVSYDTSIGMEDGAGHYNLTIYGRQFIHYARLVGMGPIQVGAVTPSPFGFSTTNAWLGPPPFPGWFG